MTYRVVLTANALREADEAYAWLSARTTRAAAWFNGLRDAIKGLEHMPARWASAREARFLPVPTRQLLYGKSPNVWRVIFVIDDNVVYVLHVRHAARARLKPGELKLPSDSDRAE